MQLIALLALVGLAILNLGGCLDSDETPTASDHLADGPREVLVDSAEVFVRVNLVGYLEEDSKIAIAFSHSPADVEFQLIDVSSYEPVFVGSLARSTAEGWGTFANYLRGRLFRPCQFRAGTSFR